MKISLWPKNTIGFIKDIGIYWIPIFIVLSVLSILISTLTFITIQSKRLREKFPIGKQVVIRGTGLHGTISKVSGCGCEIQVLIIENGKLEKVSVDGKMLE